MRLIDADEIKKREHDVILANGAKHRCFDTTRLYEIPTVDAKPVRHGKWLCDDDFDENGICSECMYDSYEPVGYVRDEWKYCPHCGAKMDAERKEE